MSWYEHAEAVPKSAASPLLHIRLPSLQTAPICHFTTAGCQNHTRTRIPVTHLNLKTIQHEGIKGRVGRLGEQSQQSNHHAYPAMPTYPEYAPSIERILTRNHEWADGLRRLNPATLDHLASNGQTPEVRS